MQEVVEWRNTRESKRIEKDIKEFFKDKKVHLYKSRHGFLVYPRFLYPWRVNIATINFKDKYIELWDKSLYSEVKAIGVTYNFKKLILKYDESEDRK